MSAFILSMRHISTLVNSVFPKYPGDGYSYFYKGEHHHFGGNNDRIGQVLLEQNYRSFNSRYNETGPAPKYVGSHDTKADPVIVLKACACYDYQSCETDDYEETEAHAIIQAIRHRAINNLPGYDEASWGID